MWTKHWLLFPSHCSALVCYQLIDRTMLSSSSHRQLGVFTCQSLSSLSTVIQDCFTHCSQARRGSRLTVCVVSVCMCETCESCVSSCNNPHPPTTEWTHSECRQSHCERLRALSHSMTRRILWKCDRGCSTLFHTLRKKGRKWKELHLSDQAWVREMAGKLMWRRVSERTRVAGNGEWALSFWGR